MGEIYLITNKVNGKRYVGQTVRTTQSRWRQHVQFAKNYNYSNALDNAIRKYGEGNFDVKRILKNIPTEDLDRLEILWIRKLNTQRHNGYNITLGGVGVRGYHPSDETKRKISAKVKGVALGHGNAVRRGQEKSGCMECRSKNPLWRKHLSESRVGRFTGKDNPFYGRQHTELTKQKISKANGKPILMFDLEGNFIKRFENGYVARDFLIQSGATSNKSCNVPINNVCHGTHYRKSAYGYIWKFDESVTTNCRDEDELHPEAQSTQK